MRRDQVLALLTSPISRLSTSYGLKSLGLFGSVARDEATSSSDIDLLVEFSGPVDLLRFMDCRFDLEALMRVQSGPMPLKQGESLVQTRTQSFLPGSQRAAESVDEFLIAESAVMGTRRRRRVRAAGNWDDRGRLECDAGAHGFSHDSSRKITPTGFSGVGQVVDAARKLCSAHCHGERVQSRHRQIVGKCGGSDLVIDDLKDVPISGKPQNCVEEIAPARLVHP